MDQEIEQLINVTWLSFGKEVLKKNFTIRFWSIDTQWMSILQAENLMNELIKNDWINEKNEEIKPNIELNQEKIKMGWMPNNDIFNEIPKNQNKSETKKYKQIKNESREIKSEIKKPLTSTERRLLRYISANTGILKEEINRRCERKKRSLGQVTTSLCLLLIAKEQGMNVEELIEGINT
tara:strand:+ start:366 stop:905 length:540 start_codon:yes stop_codon:yes gene_type:complete